MREWLFWVPALLSLFLPFFTLRFIFQKEIAEAEAGEEVCLMARAVCPQQQNQK